MSVYEIPLRAEPQTFLIDLAGDSYRMTIRWCGAMAAWVLDLDTPEREAVLHGIPLVTGTDLLGQYEYLGIEGQLRVQTLGDLEAIPTFENLGTNGVLFFITPD